MRVVFDTNIYLAAALKSEGYAREQLERSRPGGSYQIYLSPEIIVEIRAKLESRFGWEPAASAEFIKKMLLYAELVLPARRVSGVLKDTDDHIILECALEAQAAAIVTSDKGLLKLKTFENITIFHPTMLQYLR